MGDRTWSLGPQMPSRANQPPAETLKRQESVEELFEEFSKALKSPQEAGLHERASVGQVTKYDRPFMADPMLSTFATQLKDSDECEFDENGECVNQMHWGANE